MAAPLGLKVSVVAVNIIFLIFGVILLALGIWTLVDSYGLVKLSKLEISGLFSNGDQPGLLEAAAVIAIIVGIAMALLAVLAFFGVAKESKMFLALYAGLVVLLFLLMICIIVITSVMQARTDEDLESALLEGIKVQYDGLINSPIIFSKALDRAQVQFECCGVKNYTDFKTLTTIWTSSSSLMIPPACCKMDRAKYLDNDEYVFVANNCAQRPNSTTANLNKTCTKDIRDWLDEKTFVLLGVTVAVAVIHLLGITCAVCLLRHIKDDKMIMLENYNEKY